MSASSASTASKETPATNTKPPKGKKRKVLELKEKEEKEAPAEEPQSPRKKGAKPPRAALPPARLQAINGAKAVLKASEYFRKIGDKKKAEELWQEFLAQVLKNNIELTVLYT